MLDKIAQNPCLEIENYEIITGEEKHRVLFDFNNTRVEYPLDRTVVDLFEEQVKKKPDNIAVVCESESITYRELNEKANRLAQSLREEGVKQETIVGIMTDRSIHYVVGILGVMKAGGAFPLSSL